jgi:hypothetical protein
MSESGASGARNPFERTLPNLCRIAHEMQDEVREKQEDFVISLGDVGARDRKRSAPRR